MAPNDPFDREHKIRVKRTALFAVVDCMNSAHERIEEYASKLSDPELENKDVEALEKNLQEAKKWLEDLKEAKKLLQDEVSVLIPPTQG